MIGVEMQQAEHLHGSGQPGFPRDGEKRFRVQPQQGGSLPERPFEQGALHQRV